MTETDTQPGKASSVSTHVLDTAAGRPAGDVAVRVECLRSGSWSAVAAGRTDRDGRLRTWTVGTPGSTAQEPRIEDPAHAGEGHPTGDFPVGRYRLVFDIQHYFLGWGLAPFFPEVTVEFIIDGSGQHYHVPLLVSPYSYTTYRGS